MFNNLSIFFNMAEEKTYVFGEGAGNGILGLLGPMLSQRGVDPNVLLAMQGRNNDGFGEIGQAMFKVAKRFLCDNCRKKLVIEFREIDNKK